MTKARKSMLKITALLCLVFFVFSIVGPYGGMTVSAEPGTEPVNVALNKPVTSSDGTNITADHSPAKVVDGKTTHMDGWDSTSSSSMKAWVQIDLEDEFIITRVEYVDRTNFDWIGYRSNFQILASNDPNFETYVVLGGVGAEGFPDDTTWGVDVTDQTPYRYVRFQKTKVEYAYVVEIRVFGVPASEPEPEPEPENEIAFYVSPDGNDNNDGSINSPFATIEKARDTIRNLNSDMDKDIVVYLRGGEYKITDTIVFNEQDSGTNGYYITYRNYPGETPVLTGAQKIEGWQNVDGIFKTNVGSLKFRDFFVNGKRAIRSRTETHKIIKWDSTARKFYVDSSAVEGWDGINVSEVEAVLHTDWVESYTRMSSYTVDGSSVAIGLTSAGNNIFTRANPMRQVGQGVHFENSYKFLDQPGEWYLNESNGDLFYIPREGETLENINAVIPTIETFIRIQGSNKNNRVNNIRIQGITFEYTKYQSLIDNNGAIFNQGAFIGNTRQPAALYMKAADNIKIERNIFRNLGATGIDIDIMTRNNEIAGNALLDVAGNGIVEGAFRDLTGFSHTDSTTWARGNLFSNNYLRGIGTRYNGTGILVGYTNSTTIEHNEVSDVSYTAIGVGWGWTSNDTCQGNTKILNNNLYDYMNRLSDGGGIYTLSKTPGSEISGNYMHDIDRHEVISTACVRGIYLDQETEGYDVHDNVFVRLIDKIGINVVREGANQIHDNESQDPEIIANAGLEPEYWDIVPETMEQSTNASWIAQKYGAVRISGEVSSELDSVVVKVLKNGNPVLVSDPVSSSETLNFKVNIDVEKDDVISFVAEKDGNALEENVSWNLLIKPEVYPRLLIIEGIDFEGQSEEPAVISDVTSTVIAYAAGGTNLSNLDVSLQTPPGTYTVPDISTITDFSKPVKIRIYREDADEYDLEFPNGEKYREWEVSIKKEESGANVRGYNLGDVIADADNWYMSKGTKTAGVGSLRFAEGGYSIYTGRKFENELMEFNMKTDTTSAWQSIVFRTENTNDPIGNNNSCYITVIKKNEIELQRFNRG
ncbi:MAG TPA: hypothetical protein GXX36_09440, partial [Clostridiaceae bacterium]|nr:hypothetical protein [Clostridiaceae bacterium]